MPNKIFLDKWKVFKTMEENKVSKGELALQLCCGVQTINNRWRDGWKLIDASALCDFLDLELEEIQEAHND